jgi:hypothetical protein
VEGDVERTNAALGAEWAGTVRFAMVVWAETGTAISQGNRMLKAVAASNAMRLFIGFIELKYGNFNSVQRNPEGLSERVGIIASSGSKKPVWHIGHWPLGKGELCGAVQILSVSASNSKLCISGPFDSRHLFKPSQTNSKPCPKGRLSRKVWLRD